MSSAFGQRVYAESTKLAESGKDANQIANILFKQDAAGHNYGIGIVLDGEGKPLSTSSTLTKYALAEINESGIGTYQNSVKELNHLKKAVMQWQRIPESLADQFLLVLPSDAGTGAVQLAVQSSIQLNQDLTVLAVEELGWPAYKAIANMSRLNFQEFGADETFSKKNTLTIYQAGPMNTTGEVKGLDLIMRRAKAAAQNGQFPILDRAYSGFEYASELNATSYDQIMKKSYTGQIKPFIDEGVPFALALSPTKAFVTFSLRPCGLLLVHTPERHKQADVSLAFNAALRARGSSFEHPITRAFVKALLHDRGALETEHENALLRLAESEKIWKDLVSGTPMAYLFSDAYAGLFRNPKIKDDGPSHIYNQHIYPVFSQGRCRLNTTGIPSNLELAKKHVDVFSQYCH